MINVNGKDYIIMIEGLEADHLFDANGRETFDITEAVEYYSVDGLAVGTIGSKTKVAIMTASHFYYHSMNDEAK